MVSYLKNKKCAIVIFLAIIGIVATIMLSIVSQRYEPFPLEALPGESIGGNLPSDYEASSITWHPRLQNFFLVSDHGVVSSMCEKGNDMTHWFIGGDLEATTIACPQSDLIYIGKERPNAIYEFNIVTARITRRFDLSDWMKGHNNAGLEALTFVPDADDPESGLFYAGLQGTGEIMVFRLPIVSCPISDEVTHIQTIPPSNGIKDISGLHYAAGHNSLYAIYDSSNLLRAMNPDGSVIREWTLPGRDQEGITMKDNTLYLSKDFGKKGGDVFRYAPFEGINQPINEKQILD